MQYMVHTTVVVLGRNRESLYTLELIYEVVQRWKPLLIFFLNAVFEVVRKLPFRGVGSRVKRSRWSEDSFWEITAVKPSLVRLIMFHDSTSRIDFPE